MNASRSKHILLAVATGGLLFLALCLLLNGPPATASADVSFLFASPTGSGSACSRSAPCALQTALDEAWISDTIFLAGGTYTGQGSAVITLTESVNLRGGWNGAATGPLVRRPLLYFSVLDGQNERRVVYVKGGVAPVLDGLVLINGNASQGLDPRHGGGIYSNASSPIVTNNIIRHNVACSGTEWAIGAGIYLNNASESTLIAGNTIISNTANPGGNGKGGGLAVYYSDLVTIVGNTFQDNVAGSGSASQGGGIYLQDTPASVSQNLIGGNRAAPGYQGYGGGFYTQHDDVTLNGNTVAKNTSSRGAVVFSGNSRITVTNNIVARNHGGVFFRGQASPPLAGTLAHNTIAENATEGVHVGYARSGYISLNLINNVIVGHATGIYVYEDPTDIVTATHTLFYENDSDTDGGTVTSTDPIVGVDPRFVNSNQLNYHLREDSPAIDAGIAVPWLITDIDGDARPAGGGYDIGADEFVLRRVYLPLVERGA